MSLSDSERRVLEARCRPLRLPAGWPAIHYLAALYLTHGGSDAREVTEAIGRATCSGTNALAGDFAYFGAFIHRSDTAGFRPGLRDPNWGNPQTGHFFSFVMWALDGISNFEFELALGHEFVADYAFDSQVRAAYMGRYRDGGSQLRSLVLGLPLDARGIIDYGVLTSSFQDFGWPGLIHETEAPSFTTPQDRARDKHGNPYTGNSLADLRLTIAGLHFGRLIRSGVFGPSVHPVDWLERNVLDGAPRPVPGWPITPEWHSRAAAQ